MKRTLIIPLLLVFFISSTKTSAQTHFGLKAGYNLSSVVYHPKESYYKLQSIGGWQAGITTMLKLKKNWSLSSSLLFAQKGNVEKIKLHDFERSVKYRLHYLILHPALQYHFSSSSTVSFSFGAGFFGALGIGGNIKGWERDLISATYGTINRKILFSTNTNQSRRVFNPLDAGISLQTGMRYKKWGVELDYQHSLTDRDPGSYYRHYNRSGSLSLLYFFN